MSTLKPINDHASGEKTWTIRKIDSSTIEKTKLAAGKSGMKIGAWVDAKLSEAATSSLESAYSPLRKELRNVSNEIDKGLSSSAEERIKSIEENLAQLIKGQHSIFLALRDIKSTSDNLD